MNLADESGLVTLWAGLGYRLIQSYAAAQVQIEYRIRAVGPVDDPNSKAQLTLILKTGTRTEKLDVPYTTRLQLRTERLPEGPLWTYDIFSTNLRLSAPAQDRQVQHHSFLMFAVNQIRLSTCIAKRRRRYRASSVSKPPLPLSHRVGETDVLR